MYIIGTVVSSMLTLSQSLRLNPPSAGGPNPFWGPNPNLQGLYKVLRSEEPYMATPRANLETCHQPGLNPP
jgi:hypothetical protein